MKQFSAQYIFTNSGKPLKRGIITTDDEGVIVSVEDTGGLHSERHSVEFHNGIIIPGFRKLPLPSGTFAHEGCCRKGNRTRQFHSAGKK